MTQNKVQKAGAIILSKEDNKNIAVIYRAKQNNWSFPKGHVEDGESAEQAMLREVKEETGLEVNVLDKLEDNEYVSPAEGPVITKMFLTESEDDTVLIIEHPGDKIEWVPYDQVVDKLDLENLKRYYLSIFPKIKEMIQSR